MPDPTHTERNIAALHERIKADAVRIDQLTLELQLTRTSVASLASELAGLRTQVIGLLARAGTGRTA